MSEYGTIIDPYRVAPAQGNIQDYGLFARRAEETQAMRVAAALAEATRGFLSQQQGLPQGVDPIAVQQFSGEQQNQQIRGNVDQRAGQDHQSKFDAAQSFYSGYKPTQADAGNPLVQGMLSGGGNPVLMGALMDFLGQQENRNGEFNNRVRMNNDDNTSAAARESNRIAQNIQYDTDKEARAKAQADVEYQRRLDAARVYTGKGDPTGAIAENINLIGSPVVDDGVQRKQSADAMAAAQKTADDWKGKNRPDGTVGTIQEDPRIAQARLDKAFPGLSPQEIIRQVIQGTEQFGGDNRWKDVRAQNPQAYDEAWNLRQKQIQEAKVQQILESIKNPPVRELQTIGF